MDTGRLFSTGRRAKQPKPPADPELAAAMRHLMLRVYVPLYTARMHEPPRDDSRNWGILKHLLRQYGATLVEARLRAFMAWNDPWVHENGYTLMIFRSQWDRLAQRLANQRPAYGTACRHEPRCQTAAAHSQRLVQTLRGR